MIMSSLYLIFFTAFVLNSKEGCEALQLNSYFGDHMVLQRGPQRAVVWGTAGSEGAAVTVKVIGEGADESEVSTTVVDGHWTLLLPAQRGGGPYQVHVTSGGHTLSLQDVLFGDVWLCSGQSNMYFRLSNVMNASSVLSEARTFENIRFARAAKRQSDVPLDDIEFDIAWTGPQGNIGSAFAVCWLFAQEVYRELGVPMGLVMSAYGGTRIEAWSPPEAIQACTATRRRRKRAGGPRGDSILWNAMIHPLLKTTLYGALWSQGESNANDYVAYLCQKENMLEQWRAQFHEKSLQQTSASFAFGYVQLGSTVDTSIVGGFPYMRWAQTAGYGFSPNPALPDTFMAVAMDLPDYDSPQGAIHPRHKAEVARRLALGGLSVAYGRGDHAFQGPLPSALRKAGNSLNVQYGHGTANLDVRSTGGFEVCCSWRNATHCDYAYEGAWVAAPITEQKRSHVTLDTSGCGRRHVVGMRYEWRQSPCALLQCGLYDARSNLPAPPFVQMHLNSPDIPLSPQLG